MDKLIALLDSIELPYALNAFPTKSKSYTPPEPPFMCYIFTGSDNIGADNKVWKRVENVSIELYTDAKDPTQEAKIRNALDNAGIFYETTETNLPSDRLYMVVFSFQMEVNNG